ncbi:MAG: hypothetical protein WDO68_02145 [Gammaproteobacteria bacterium]
MVAWNKPGSLKVGTVGRPAEPGTVSLAPDGEAIVTRTALLSHGYFEAPEEDSRATFIGPHSVATGDIARFDEQGFLTITGRKKDAIIARSGEKFHPEPIEALIQDHARIKAALVTSSDRNSGMTAILVVARRDDETTTDIRRHIERVNSGLPACQRVTELVFTEQDFTVDNGLRTKNLKLNRNAIRAALLTAAPA